MGSSLKQLQQHITAQHSRAPKKTHNQGILGLGNVGGLGKKSAGKVIIGLGFQYQITKCFAKLATFVS